MKWPLLREAHARNDRIHKPDYREKIALEGDNFDRGGHSPRKPSSVYQLKGNTILINTNHPDYKSKPQIYLEHILRRESVFKIFGYESKIGWNKKTFSKHNHIEGQSVDSLHRKIIEELDELLRITIKNFRRTDPIKVNSQGRIKYSYHFKSGFVPIKIGKLENKDFILAIDFFNAEK